ncbi:MAG: prepilin-type N-terminal cleavage/methylation domain-containing protein [Gammaproteobacteria bacterium]|nr:prepilin-type N-terminal cleavage/methylation domain-containing protein [Gammaproteobacteria bacterium]
MGNERKSNQSGFTLIELAVVLVIIGIILGAVLKGQELINSSKVKKVQSDIHSMETMMLNYYDRKGRWPGDCNLDGNVGFTLPNNSVATALNAVATDPSAISCEATSPVENQDTAFADLRAAGVAPRSTTNASLGKHVLDGAYNIGYTRDTATGATANAIVAYGIPSWMAKMIDVATDGAENGKSGRVRRWDQLDSGINGGTWPLSTADSTPVALVYFYDRTLP